MLPSTIEIVPLAAAQLPPLIDQFVTVYREAFAAPPYNEDAAAAVSFGNRLLLHATRDGFRCVVARADAQPVVGFAYGYTLASGQWWYDVLRAHLDQAVQQRWLRDCFDLIDLAVQPSAQGQGLGGRLHDALLADLPHRRALLATYPAETPALQLYRKRGWVLVRDAFFAPGNVSRMLLGLELPRR